MIKIELTEEQSLVFEKIRNARFPKGDYDLTIRVGFRKNTAESFSAVIEDKKKMFGNTPISCLEVTTDKFEVTIPQTRRMFSTLKGNAMLCALCGKGKDEHYVGAISATFMNRKDEPHYCDNF